MKKLTQCIAVIAALLSTQSANADFYDGVRGPSKAQVHYTASIADTSTHSIATKYFGDDIFAVGVLATDSQAFQGGFAGVGYIAGELDRIKALPVLGYGLSGDGKQGTLNTILQATAFLDENGTFLADPRYIISIPAHGQENHTPSHTFGLTPSVGDATVRVGPDLTYTLGQAHLNVGILLRYDIDAKGHSSWVEMGFDLEGRTQFQFRGNF